MATNGYVGFAGRKLIALLICLLAMVVAGLVSLGICAADALDPSVATNLTITISGGICTLFATFCGANVGEHWAKKGTRGEPPPSQPQPDAPLPPGPRDPAPE